MRASVLSGLVAVVAAAATACSAHPSSGQDPADAEVVLLPYPDGGVEWDGWAGQFVGDYCVQCHNPQANCGGTNCHPANGPVPDFTIHTQVTGYAPIIRCGIAVQQDPSWQCGNIPPKKFPVYEGDNPMPTDEQRAIVVQWIEAGCP